MKTIHILGASGFIGSYLLNHLSKEFNVVGYSSKQCDLLSSDSIHNALSNINKEDIIIISSAITRLKENSFNSLQKNVLMAENLAKFLESHKISQLIFFSTIDVYGSDVPGEIHEGLVPNPQDYYSLSKLISEHIFKISCFKNKIPLYILRLSGIYGPGDNNKSTVNKLVTSAFNKLITIYGDGADKRDFVFVDDIYRFINLLISNPKNTTLNFATGNSYSIDQIVRFIQELMPYQFSIEYKRPAIKKNRASNLLFNTTKMKKQFPSFEFTDIKKALPLYIKDYKLRNGRN